MILNSLKGKLVKQLIQFIMYPKCSWEILFILILYLCPHKTFLKKEYATHFN